MIDKFELQKEAQNLRQAIEIAQTSFVFEPNIKEYVQRLVELENICEHEYLNGACIWCGRSASK